MIQYDGTDFFGSQIQPGKRTVQGTLKQCIKDVFKVDSSILMASRTDRGVHATHNVATFKLNLPGINIAKIADILNEHLPPDLRVVSSRLVPPGFHPRYMAVRRDYQYRIFLSPRDDIRYIRFSNRISEPLNIEAMKATATIFLGKHDYSHFAVDSGNIKDPICEVYSLRLIKKGRFLLIKLSANRFLRRMVCKIVGALIAVGKGELSPVLLRDALEGIKPPRPFPEAPPKGLTLTGIFYPEELLNLFPET